MQSFHVDAHGFQLFPSISPVAFGLFKPPAQGRLFGGSGESPLTPMVRTKSGSSGGSFWKAEKCKLRQYSAWQNPGISTILLLLRRKAQDRLAVHGDGPAVG